MPDLAQHDARGAGERARQSGAPAPDPCVMVIFGAGGDLTKRLVVPALYNLANTGLVPEGLAIIGADIADHDTESWTGSLHDMLEEFVKDPNSEEQLSNVDDDVWSSLAGRMRYVQGDFTDEGFYESLKSTIESVDKEHGSGGNRLFYLAVADRFFGTIIERLGKAGLVDQEEDGPWRRVVIEKPFGHDLESARALNESVHAVLDERQIYRIDHFLGKETVQNIMAFRFANGIFEPIWNRHWVDHVQITVAETIGVGQRGKFYEPTGALRDMVPNHMFQLLAMTAMEPPSGFSPESIRDKKYELFSAIETIDADHAVRGQYGDGEVSGERAGGYRQEKDVAEESVTETYVALRLAIDNWRWAGVPFFLRTGKRMPERLTEIAVRFRRAPLKTFQGTRLDATPANWLVLRIQPEEGISLLFEVKRPGQVVRLEPVKMDFRYADWFAPEPNVGYETLLYDVMIGDQTLFQRADMVEETWRAVDGVLEAWQRAPGDFPNYAAGSAGPEAADRLIGEGASERRWREVALPEDKDRPAKETR